MILGNEVWAVIPARGGSKGIPHKNIKHLCNVPLIAYSIIAAKQSKLIDRVFVSTDDEEIAKTALKYGAEVPFLRPAELATDNANLKDAINYTLDRVADKEGYIPEIYTIIYPTSPFRTPEIIDSMLNLCSEAHTISTARPLGIGSQDSLVTIQQGEYKSIKLNPALNYIPKMFSKLGNAYCSLYYPQGCRYDDNPQKAIDFESYKMKVHGSARFKRGCYYWVLEDECTWIDLDSEYDWYVAESIIERGIYKWITETSRQFSLQMTTL